MEELELEKTSENKKEYTVLHPGDSPQGPIYSFFPDAVNRLTKRHIARVLDFCDQLQVSDIVKKEIKQTLWNLSNDIIDMSEGKNTYLWDPQKNPFIDKQESSPINPVDNRDRT